MHFASKLHLFERHYIVIIFYTTFYYDYVFSAIYEIKKIQNAVKKYINSMNDKYFPNAPNFK